MLLTCPSCSMRYLVADASIGEEGRTVRCAACGHQWHQDGFPPVEIVDSSAPPPAPEEAAPQASDIPDGVKPIPEERAAPVLSEEAQAMRERDLIARVCGYFAAFVVLLLVFLIFALAKGPVTQLWPGSVMLYELAGLKPPVPGDGLIVDQVEARVEDGTLVIDGRIINLSAKRIAVPKLKAAILDAAGETHARYDIPVEASALDGESDVGFELSVPMPNETAQAVRVGFSS